MGGFDRFVSVVVALTLNLVAHMIASNTSKELTYEDKVNRTVMVLATIGLVAVFTAKRIKGSDKQNRKYLVFAQGLWYGGLLLILTPLLVVWGGVENDMKIVLLTILMGLIVCYTKSWTDNQSNTYGGEVTDLDELE